MESTRNAISRTSALIRRVLGALALAVLFAAASCRMGKEYSRPEMQLPPEIANAKYDSLALAEMKWWDVYQDKHLKDLISRALQYNKDLLISDARIREMEARAAVSRAALAPEISYMAYASREVFHYKRYNGWYNDPEQGAKLVFNWEVDLWGKLRWGREQGIANLGQSIEERRAATVSVIAQVAQAYFEIVALDNELRTVRQTLEARKEGMELAQLRFEGGLTSETSLQQAKVEYARTATRIPILEQNIALKQNTLAFLLGEFPHHIERSDSIMTESWNLRWQDSVPANLSTALIERRPDIRAAEQKLIAANAAVGIAYTNRFPKLQLTANGGIETEYFKDFFTSPIHWLYGGITGPLLDFGKRKRAQRAQEAAYEAECLRYEKVVISAFKEVSEALLQFNKIKQIHSSYAELEAASKKAMELAALQYKNGSIGYLDLLVAQRSYFDAQVSLVNAERDKRLALVKLYKALGGGWE